MIPDDHTAASKVAISAIVALLKKLVGRGLLTADDANAIIDDVAGEIAGIEGLYGWMDGAKQITDGMRRELS